uniref:Uncharacterized protein n=1 Tax=Sphaerodactylus townsendi TaxID=933632 RepID=A0ACB8FYI2_9SAUR
MRGRLSWGMNQNRLQRRRTGLSLFWTRSPVMSGKTGRTQKKVLKKLGKFASNPDLRILIPPHFLESLGELCLGNLFSRRQCSYTVFARKYCGDG